MKISLSKVLLSLAFLGGTAGAQSSDPVPAGLHADKLALSLTDVDDRIQAVDFYTCYGNPEQMDYRCPAKLVVTRKDGSKVEKLLTEYTDVLLNNQRDLFSSEKVAIVAGEHHLYFPTDLTHSPLLSAIVTHLQLGTSEISAEVQAIGFREVLSYDGPYVEQTQKRPQSEEAYKAARDARETLTLLANEMLGR